MVISTGEGNPKAESMVLPTRALRTPSTQTHAENGIGLCCQTGPSTIAMLKLHEADGLDGTKAISPPTENQGPLMPSLFGDPSTVHGCEGKISPVRMGVRQEVLSATRTTYLKWTRKRPITSRSERPFFCSLLSFHFQIPVFRADHKKHTLSQGDLRVPLS